MRVGYTTGVMKPVVTVSTSAGVSELTCGARHDDVGAVVVVEGEMRCEADVLRELHPPASPP